MSESETPSEIIAYADGEPIYADGPTGDTEANAARRLPSVPCYVYFIQGKHGGPIKIGLSETPRHRLASLQRGTPYVLTIRRLIRGGFAKEHELHRRFAEYRIGGEWFRPAPELAEFARARQGEEPPIMFGGYEHESVLGEEDSKNRIKYAEVLREQRKYWREQRKAGARSNPSQRRR